MTESPNPKLTDGQKECLRLVDRLLTSKEIGRRLRISPFTVDQRLDAARRKLGVRTRKDAARIFASMDANHISQPLVYETPALAVSAFIRKPLHQEIVPQDIIINDAHLTALSGTHDQAQGSDCSFALSLPMLGGEEHGLRKTQVVAEIVKVAVFAVVGMSALVIMMIGIMRMLSAQI